MANQVTLWLRAETKPGEARTALIPAHAAQLIARGFEVVVESSEQRAFATEEYKAQGCQIQPAGAWRSAPTQTYVLGLKELPDDGTPLSHRHIYFAHAFKGQLGARPLLSRFTAGGGALLDLEYLLDDQNRRVAAFGFWAGYVGAALAFMTWCGQARGSSPSLGAVTPWIDRNALVEDCRRAALDCDDRLPSMLVIGALGRVGSGARTLANELGLEVTPWDIKETATGGPFQDILRHTIFVNCVLVNSKMPPFLTKTMLERGDHLLRVIADISCDPYSDCNPLPIYNTCTDTGNPLITLDCAPPVDLIAIDNLPSLLPKESSADFSEQLLPCLQALDHDHPTWEGALTLFHHHRDKAETHS